ncbi:TIGR01212 family radical SAM protein [Vallitalea okinawensis]|uniref:TIGR01212 family radical SAM protein n=1 Tax=Vallitalea okinawensis TaxID=2078660 RepID=UPI000CFCB430|nr:TIGR01212 family radical SAM protein [Vallitalea okinawensis]
MYWDDKPYYSLSYKLKEKYGEKVFKIALDAGFTCPNRDGTIDSRGCIFCSAGGSGDFASSKQLSIHNQIEEGKLRLQKKFKGDQFIAYFQAYTNTYGDLDYLRKVYFEAANHPDIVAISIATRPDCLSAEVCELLKELNQIVDVWVELGLQTIHEESAVFMRRGYTLQVFNDAVSLLTSYNLDIIVHIILGLPGESQSDMLTTVKYVSHLPIQGIKLQLLHVLKDTDLEKVYLDGDYQPLEREEYIDLVIDCIANIPSHIVIHRITGDAPWKLLVAPRWSTDKKNIFNQTLKRFKQRDSYQGKAFHATKSTCN